MLCLNCGRGKAIKIDLLGWLPCKKCQARQSKERMKDTLVLEGQDIKQQRKQYNPDILQPWRSGVLSKEYIKKYGTKGLNIEPGEEKKAKNVWSGDQVGYQTYYKGD